LFHSLLLSSHTSYFPPPPSPAISTLSLHDALPICGWPYVSELDRQGHVLFDAYFGHGKRPGADADTYRAYRFVWHGRPTEPPAIDRKSTRLNSSHVAISYAVFCLKKKKKKTNQRKR